MSGIRAFDRQPVASTTYFAVTVLPSDVATCHKFGALVEGRPIDAGIELNIAAQIKTVGDVVGVFQNLRLRRVALAPVPFLLQFVGKRIGILHAFDIAARAGVTVPVPGAADVATLLIDPHGKSLPAQPVQHVHSRKARADHDDIVGLGAAAWLLPGTDCKADIRTPSDFSGVASQHSIPGVKAQATKMQLARWIFCPAECAINDTRHNEVTRRLRARLPGETGLASAPMMG